MTRIQQSVEINAPVHIAYGQLTQFEEYPRFMQDVETVRQLDATHLHWTSRIAGRSLEWDSEITQQSPDRCIAWRNLNGPPSEGKVDLQPLGQDKARVILTMECEPAQMIGAPDAEAAIAHRLEQDLLCLKQMIEARGQAPVPSAAYAAGSEGWDGSEDPHEPVRSAARKAAGNAAENAGQNAAQGQRQSGAPQAERGADATTQSDASLSRMDDQEGQGRYTVAAEQNFDQQSDQARRVGQMPADGAGEAMKQSMEAPKSAPKSASNSASKSASKQQEKK